MVEPLAAWAGFPSLAVVSTSSPAPAAPRISQFTEQECHHAVFSVLAQVLDPDDLRVEEFLEKDRPRDDYINHEVLRNWFKRRLHVVDEHRMSLREIWRNFCYEHRIYCSLPLFGNVVLRHVLQADPGWKGVTKTGDIKQKRYNLEWIPNGIPPATEEELEAFFAKIKEDKERADRATSRSTGQSEKELVMGKDHSIFLDPSALAKWWIENLEPSDQNECRMRMRDVYERFVQDTDIRMPKALFGELSVRYVLSRPEYAPVVRKGKIHSKRYSLRWRVPSTTSSSAPSNSPPGTSRPQPVAAPAAAPPPAPVPMVTPPVGVDGRCD